MKFKSLATAVATLLLPMAVWAVPVAVSILPAVQSVAQGGNVLVTVRIDGLSGVPDQLSAYDLRITYDPGLLSFVSQSFLADARFGGGAFELFDSGTAGLLVDIVDSPLTTPAELIAAQNGFDGFDLFSLTFTAANADAFTNLGFSVVPNISPYVLGNNNGNILDATYAGACVGIGAGVCGDVTPAIPEPGTFGLMAMGLLVAGAVGRRAKRRSKGSTVAA